MRAERPQPPPSPPFIAFLGRAEYNLSGHVQAEGLRASGSVHVRRGPWLLIGWRLLTVCLCLTIFKETNTRAIVAILSNSD